MNYIIPKTFAGAEWWRSNAERWDALASAAEADGDARDANLAKSEASHSRQNARLKELEDPS